MSVLPSRLALAVAIALTGLSPSLPVRAADNTVVLRDYDLPAAPLAATLNRIAREAGLALSVDAAAIGDAMSAPVRGRYSAADALRRALTGSGFELVTTPAGSHTLKKLPAAPAPRPQPVSATEATLAEVKVRASAQAGASSFRVPTVKSATKTDTRALDIPQSIQVVEQELMREQRALAMADTLRNVPGVYAQGGEGRRDQFSIRGFSAELDMYVDGLREPASFRDLSNVERVEVLKGPAAMLFGRGSAGGIINRVTKKPVDQPQREVQLTGGSWDFARAEADLGGPINEAASYRLTAAYEKGGQFRDVLDNEKSAVAGALAFKLAPQTSLLAQFDYQHHDVTPDRGIPSVGGRPAGVPVENFYGERFDYGERDVANVGVTLEHALSAQTQVRAVLRANTMELDAINTRSTGLANNNTEVRRNTTFFPKERDYLTAQAELTHKLALGTTEHLLLAGYERNWQYADLKVYQVAAPNIGLADPRHVAPTPVFGEASKTYDVSTRGTTDGLYLQDQISFTPAWKAVAGVRRDVFGQHQDAGLLNRVASPAVERTDRAWSPRLGVIWQPSAGSSFYGSVSRSFQPVADDLLFSNASRANLAPTESKQVEIGNKNEFFGGRLALDVALYRVALSNVATADPNNTGQLIQVGEQVHRGVEVSVSGEPAPGWRIYGGATWIDAEITRSNDTPEGNRPGNVPRRAANLWVSHELGAGFSAGVGAFYVGQRYAAADNTVVLPSYTRWDAALIWRLHALELALNLRNLGDKRYFETATNNFQLAPGVPRQVLLTARYGF